MGGKHLFVVGECEIFAKKDLDRAQNLLNVGRATTKFEEDILELHTSRRVRTLQTKTAQAY